MSNETIKITIWNYVKNERKANIHQIANALNLSEAETLSIVESLHSDKYLKVIPVPLDASSDCSCYYSVTENEFKP